MCFPADHDERRAVRSGSAAGPGLRAAEPRGHRPGPGLPARPGSVPGRPGRGCVIRSPAGEAVVNW